MESNLKATVIADSISRHGHRVTTIEATMHRFVLAEFNTHRMFSRNSASSRAIPAKKQIEKISKNPAIPVEYGSNQKGMQAGEPLGLMDAQQADYLWLKAKDAAVESASRMSEELGIHKQVVNRMLEPWMWHTVIVTSTNFDNFFDQRCSKLAQPEIRVVAEKMRSAMSKSSPVLVENGDWHLPYIQDDELHLDVETRKKISAARCARVSYLTHDGSRDIQEDLELYDRLVSANPPHASPLEHVAMPDSSNVAHVSNGSVVRDVPVLGNLVGWRQLRHHVNNEFIVHDHR